MILKQKNLNNLSFQDNSFLTKMFKKMFRIFILKSLLHIHKIATNKITKKCKCPF